MCFTSVVIFCIVRLFFLIYNFLYFSCSPLSLPPWISYNDHCLLSLLDTDNSSIQRRKLTQCRIQSKHNYLNFSDFTFIWFVELISYFFETSGRDDGLPCTDQLRGNALGGERRSCPFQRVTSKARPFLCTNSRCQETTGCLAFPKREWATENESLSTRPWFFLRNSLWCVLRQDPQHLLPHPLSLNMQRSEEGILWLHLYSMALSPWILGQRPGTNYCLHVLVSVWPSQLKWLSVSFLRE